MPVIKPGFDVVQHVAPFIEAPDGTAHVPTGVSGRLPVAVTLAIGGGKTISVRPKQGGVSVIGTNAATASVSAVGKVVTLTAKNDGTTTVTAMLALIAASPTVDALLAISGTGTDTFAGNWSVAETPLWTAGTIPANAIAVFGPDGYWWPAEADPTGGLKVSQSSQISGENGKTGSDGRILTQVPGVYGTLRTGTEVLYAAPCKLVRLIITTTTAATGDSVIRDGGAAGTIMFYVRSATVGTQVIDVNGTHGSNVHFTAGSAWVGSIVAVVDPA